MKKKFILFDFDGTLVDSLETSISVINNLAVKNNVKPFNLQEINELRKLPIVERCKRVKFPLYKIPFVILEFYRLYKKNMASLKLFDGIAELFEQLESHQFQIAIISSNSKENINDFLKGNQITCIKEIITSNNIFGKNLVIDQFLKKHRLSKSDVLYVGDELRDIVACKQVGVKIIWVPWGYYAIEVTERESPDYFAKSPKDILTIATNYFS